MQESRLVALVFTDTLTSPGNLNTAERDIVILPLIPNIRRPT
ncbi:MAG TPA: hypothetical protein VJ023_08600 [Pyrinomonadaceae bacterium]|nr:hypothetical protein [Pyrinomonadaceae bacterium]